MHTLKKNYFTRIRCKGISILATVTEQNKHLEANKTRGSDF